MFDNFRERIVVTEARNGGKACESDLTLEERRCNTFCCPIGMIYLNVKFI